MRTTVNLDPYVLSALKAMAVRERRTIGEVIDRLTRDAVKGSSIELDNGIPVMPNRRSDSIVTSEHVYELLDEGY